MNITDVVSIYSGESFSTYQEGFIALPKKDRKKFRKDGERLQKRLKTRELLNQGCSATEATLAKRLLKQLPGVAAMLLHLEPAPPAAAPAVAPETQSETPSICSITTQPIENEAKAPCGHKFEATAIQAWLRIGMESEGTGTCPDCKSPLLPDELTIAEAPGTESEPEICAITLEEIVIKAEAPCGHKFEATEIQKWLAAQEADNGKSSCPECRRDLKPEDLTIDGVPGATPSSAPTAEGGARPASARAQPREGSSAPVTRRVTGFPSWAGGSSARRTAAPGARVLTRSPF